MDFGTEGVMGQTVHGSELPDELKGTKQTEKVGT